MRPTREVATNNGQTYFVTSNCAERRPLFRKERWIDLMVETLLSYRPERYLLHEFTIMPDHFHILITPVGSLERAVQCVKGGFSFKAKKSFEWHNDIWAVGFSDHRVRGLEDYEVHCRYIARNAVKARLVEDECSYKYASTSGLYAMDAVPQGLKPDSVMSLDGGTKVPPFQS